MGDDKDPKDEPQQDEKVDVEQAEKDVEKKIEEFEEQGGLPQGAP